MKKLLWVLIGLCLPLVSPVSASSDPPLIGRWTVVEAKVGPWYDGSGAKPDVDPKLAHATFVFGKDSVKAPALGCSKVKYTVSTVGPDYLFEGGLKNPSKDAAALGFKSDKIVSVNQGCISSGGDLEMDYAMLDHDTAVFGLNNVVYRMKREK